MSIMHLHNGDCSSNSSTPHTPNYKYRKYKWLNYRQLACEITGSQDTIVHVYFFTAYARWRQASFLHHKKYIQVLRSQNIQIIRGNFMKKHVKCHHCNQRFLTHEEKGTDVNLALQVLRDAVDDQYDRALIISSDSDLLPAIEAVHAHAADKEVGVMFPIGRRSYHLEQGADFKRKMNEKLLQASQFPDEVQVGSTIITKPSHWV